MLYVYCTFTRCIYYRPANEIIKISKYSLFPYHKKLLFKSHLNAGFAANWFSIPISMPYMAAFGSDVLLKLGNGGKSFFKSPSQKVKNSDNEELSSKKASQNQSVPLPESPEKAISFKRKRKIRQIIESDEETCDNPCLEGEHTERISIQNGRDCKHDINGQRQDDKESLEDQPGAVQGGNATCKTVIKSELMNDTNKSKSDQTFDKSDVSGKCALKADNVSAVMNKTENDKNKASISQKSSEGDVPCENNNIVHEISAAKRKKSKTLKGKKTKHEKPEVLEKDADVPHSRKTPKSKGQSVRKRKSNELKESVDEKTCKKSRKGKIAATAAKIAEESYSSESDTCAVSVSREDCSEMEIKKDDGRNASHGGSQFHSFFTNRKQHKLPEVSSKAESQEKTEKSSSATQKTDAVYDPSKNRYHPIDDACWKRGEKVPYLALAKTMEAVESVSGRLKTIEILANFFRSVIVLSPEDLLHSVYLCLNKLAPEYMGIELGVGETLLVKAVAQATGRTVDKIKAEVNLKGDLGLVAENSRGNQRVMFAPPKLTISSVFSKFKEIAQMSGNAAMTKKVDKIQALFVACRLCEAKYIIRSLSGKLRIGLAEQSVLAALAQAATLTPPCQTYPPEVLNASLNKSPEAFKKKVESQTLILKTTYCECPNYDMIIPILLKEGFDELPKHCHLSPGIPLKHMLAHPTKGIDEVLRRFDNNEFTCEFKYDGERAQIHVIDGHEVKIYSRNQEDNTSKYPDIVSRIPKALKSSTGSCIIDSEVIAWDQENKQILPFQVLSTRKRKAAVESEITVQVCIVAFDLLYLNGQSLVKRSLKERRGLLHEHFSEVENEFLFVKAMDGNNADVMQDFLEESVKGNCEGLMVKSLEVDASYEIAKRSHNWLKLKKDYLDGVGDTLDLVVIGGFHGKGKRCGGYGGFLLACYDDENEEFQSICKIGTGIKEEEFESHSTFFKQHVVPQPKPYYRYDNSLEPDVWFEPVQVWEVKCADLSISPVHKAAVGLVDPEKGISLRFPRFLRIRDDKKTEEATTSNQVAHMYSSQEQVQNQKGKASKLEDEDYY